MGCNKKKCQGKTKAVSHNSHSSNNSGNSENGCCLVNKYINNNRVITCEKSKKYRPYCAICPARCDKCSSSDSLHLLSGSSNSCSVKKGCNFGCGIYNGNNCAYINPYGGNCPVQAKYVSSLDSCCFGSDPCSSSSSSSSSRSCSTARAPSPCESCPSEKPCCESCKYCRVQKYFKNKRNQACYNPRYNYKVSRVSNTDCPCNKKGCNKGCDKKEKKGKKDDRLFCYNDYKLKLENDKLKKGILVEINGNCFKVDGQNRKKLELKVGHTYRFNVVQESKDGLYHHFFCFTKDNQGGHIVRGKKVFPEVLKGAPKPCAHGSIKLKVTKDMPKTFYYQDVNTPNMGGQVVIIE